MLGYCDNHVCARLFGFSVMHDCVGAGHFGSRTDCLLPEKHLLRTHSCLAARGIMVARPPGSTGTLTAKHHTKNSYSGRSKRALAATLLVMMAGPINGRKVSQVTRLRIKRGRPRLRLQKLRSSRAVTEITDVPLRTMLRASNTHPRPVILQRHWQQRRTLHDRGWGRTPSPAEKPKGKSQCYL